MVRSIPISAYEMPRIDHVVTVQSSNFPPMYERSQNHLMSASDRCFFVSCAASRHPSNV